MKRLLARSLGLAYDEEEKYYFKEASGSSTEVPLQIVSTMRLASSIVVAVG